jgi:hypothetical protein
MLGVMGCCYGSSQVEADPLCSVRQWTAIAFPFDTQAAAYIPPVRKQCSGYTLKIRNTNPYREVSQYGISMYVRD